VDDTHQPIDAPAALFLDGAWEAGAGERTREGRDPSTGASLGPWQEASPAQLERAVRGARSAAPTWAERPLAEREAVLRRFAGAVEARREVLLDAIVREAGKPPWEARTEVDAVIGKVELTLRAWHQRCAEFGTATARTRFKPHGVLAVLGPFNFPAHLPNGHIVPALLAGNAVIFKPSERTPAAAGVLAACWAEAGLPPGVLQVVPGGGALGAALATHEGIDGLLFTGGEKVGEHLRQAFAERPGKILALELGGNNPLVAWDADPRAAVPLILQSAFATAGQRCTCARRLILPADARGDALLDALLAGLARMRVGPARATPPPFMGPVIGEETALALLEAQARLTRAGARPLQSLQHLRAGTGLVTPGLLDVSALDPLPDEEFFGPLLLVQRAGDFEAALDLANRTRFGLAAGLLSPSRELYERFFARVRAGIINWNTALPGASGAAPFGGVGASGNHRPSGFFAVDYCAYPVASLECGEPLPPSPAPPGLGDD
jgi:succinylglutamic semialdehyde dehydrogenase